MDDVIQEVGGCGRFQVFHVALTQACQFFGVWGFYLMLFGSFEPPWECVRHPPENDSLRWPVVAATTITTKTAGINHLGPNGSSHTSSLATTNVSAGILNGDEESLNGDMASVDLDVFGASPDWSNSTGTCSIFRSCDEIRFDSESLTIVTEFALVCDQAWILSLIIFVQMLGVFFGSYLGSHLGELLGMRIVLYGNVFLFAASVSLATLSGFWEMYAAFLFLVGLGTGGIFGSVKNYSMEPVNSSWRHVMGLIPLWSASLSFFVLAAFVLKDWRQLHLLTAGLASATLFGAFCVTPSIRWLVFHDYIKKAEKAVWRIARINRCPAPRDDVLDSLTEELERESHQVRNSPVCLNFCADYDSRKLTLKLSYLWLSTWLCYVAMGFGVKSLSGDFYLNIALACVTEIPAVLTVCPLLQRLGSRWAALPLLCLSASACLAASVYYYAFSHQGEELRINFLLFTAKASTLAAWYAISSSTPHLYPKSCAKASADYFALVMAASGVLAPPLIAADQTRVGASCAVMSLALLIGVPVQMLLPAVEVTSFPATPPPTTTTTSASRLDGYQWSL